MGSRNIDRSKEDYIVAGFLRLGPWVSEPNDALQSRYDELNEVATTVANVCLGITLECAQHHDHPEELLSSTDYYRLLGSFNVFIDQRKGESKRPSFLRRGLNRSSPKPRSHTVNNERHRKFVAETDQPIASLCRDLKVRGLWDETLIIWGGEFGRTLTREASSNGRDHNPHGFTMLPVGGAIRPGHIVRATDEIGLEAVENPISVHDPHATFLHLFRLDHEAFTFLQNGREHRLTGPQPAKVIREVLA